VSLRQVPVWLSSSEFLLLQANIAPLYVSLLQADSLLQSTSQPVSSLMTLTASHIGHFKGGSRRARPLIAAGQTTAVLLETLQRDHGPLRMLSSFSPTSPARTGEVHCLDNAVAALARVANSEGSHAVDSLAISSHNPQNSVREASRSVASGGCLEANVIFRTRLVPAASPPPPPGPDRWQQGSVVVSGGLGGLGLLAGLWMTQQGCSALVLLSRSGRGTPSQLAPACGLDAEVTMVRCDVSVASEVAGVERGGRVSHVIHAGGVLKDGVVGSQTAAGLREVYAPKALGLRNLGAAFCGSGPMVMAYSSIAGVLGSAGQANYAAANAYMDAWADVATQQVHFAVNIQHRILRSYGFIRHPSSPLRVSHWQELWRLCIS